ncbi:MAG: amylo-alpha-1,6-glucosidase [Actinomycetota bacterium]|nr:amylo-alpha-1,6-glucosidase [Actinomycetota bacterium]
MRPLLHDLVSCVSAPALALSAADGQVRPGGVQGWFRGDRRMLSALTLTVDGREPDGLRGSSTGASAASFTAVARHAGDALDDPSVRVDRTRELSDRRLVESITVSSSAQAEVPLEVVVQVSSDLAPMARVRTGERPAPVRAQADADGFAWRLPDDELAGVPGAEPLSVVLRCDPAPDDVDAAHGCLRWRGTLPGRGALNLRLTAEVHGQDTGFTAPDLLPWSVPRVDCADVRVPALVRQGVDDLGGLLLRDDGTADHFVAAGTPWFLTLFGRDSLWAARMLLPLGTDLAVSTLRTLARRQGTRDDPETEEQPGKILHEVRAGQQVLGDLTLPPVYYGTVDATSLFVVLLADAWRWGADRAQVEPLLPHARSCLGWMEQQAGDGFLRYVDATGHGLTNQGWKDSPDGVQWADGRLAEPPIALSEVQAYAYQAAVLGADLFDAFGLTDAQHWREWAYRLAVRFRDAFWVEDERGRYPAVALDRDGRPVDSVASNMGHLLGTGLLDRDEAGVVADRLCAADMDSGFGLRTLTSRSPRYSALSYHGGSVWPHDTAIAVHGLCREGHRERAVGLLRGLVAAAPAFGYRLPELYSGDEAGPMRAPAPYPSACRPQAWAAAAPLWALVSVLGVEVDAPRGVLRVPARVDTGLGPLAVRGLRVGGHRLDVEVGADGAVTPTTRHPHLEVRTGP